jgi:DNA ligase-associated metallophosphoesterase
MHAADPNGEAGGGGRARGDPDAHGADAFAVALAGTRVALLAERALWWPDERTLFVADLHLGKAETFRALGVPVPDGPTAATLRRLDALVRARDARRVVVLGDLLHARQAHTPATLGVLAAWRDAHPRLDCVLVRGNHDDHAGDPPAALGIACVDPGAPLGPFTLHHAPAPEAGGQPPGDGHRLCGHVHPAVRLRGRAGDSIRLRCFVVGRAQTVLPAFGDFTGAACVTHGPGLRVVAIAGDRVFELPRIGMPA